MYQYETDTNLILKPSKDNRRKENYRAYLTHKYDKKKPPPENIGQKKENQSNKNI